MVVGCLLLVSSSAWAKDVVMDTDQKKASYAFGLQIGRNLKSQRVDQNIDAFSRARSGEPSKT